MSDQNPVAWRYTRIDTGDSLVCQTRWPNFSASIWAEAPLYTAPPPAAMPAWQPIETAPKDGTAILVNDSRCTDGFASVRWSEFHNGWLRCNRMGFEDFATHWMPLLELPK